jgi:hypothetical protein
MQHLDAKTQAEAKPKQNVTRRESLRILASAATGFAAGKLISGHKLVAEVQGNSAQGNASADQDEKVIRAGLEGAIHKNFDPALLQRAYPGHFTIDAKGSYGLEVTWTGLDSWQMSGAYLLLGKHREMLDYFDFVEASQRRDGDIPWAIFPGDKPPAGMNDYLRGLRYPQDVYTYKPIVRPGQPKYSDMRRRKWIGLFTHWEPKANPLSVLGPICFILTGQEIFAATHSESWLSQKLPTLQATGRYLLSRISPNGLMSGAGFYIENPPRNQWDGVTQCYAVYAFRQLAFLSNV